MMRTVRKSKDVKDMVDVEGECPYCGNDQAISAPFRHIQFELNSFEYTMSRSQNRPHEWPHRQSCGIVMIAARCRSKECSKTIVWSEWVDWDSIHGIIFSDQGNHRWMQPDFVLGQPLPESLPDGVKRDHMAARNILNISTAASGAL